MYFYNNIVHLTPGAGSIFCFPAKRLIRIVFPQKIVSFPLPLGAEFPYLKNNHFMLK
jgi:hypothetical protein